MRINAPPPFRLQFEGPEGSYTLDYRPIDDWDGVIDVEIADMRLSWSVDNVERNAEGLQLGGMTIGTEALWKDVFWFVLQPEAQPAIITYWGDRVIWRTDSVVTLG